MHADAGMTDHSPKVDVPFAGRILPICRLTLTPTWLTGSPRECTLPVAIQNRIG
jgi:hypothetical protein